jgi:hypothetical protein
MMASISASHGCPLPPLRERRHASIGVQHLDTDMVGAGVEVLLHAVRNALGISPGDDVVDDAVLPPSSRSDRW